MNEYYFLYCTNCEDETWTMIMDANTNEAVGIIIDRNLALTFVQSVLFGVVVDTPDNAISRMNKCSQS